MFKKLNSTTLLIILLVLSGFVAFNKFYLSKKSESTFNDVFIAIDSAKVTQILVYPKAENGKEIKITKQGKGWQLQNAQNKSSASEPQIHNLVQVFADLKSLALAGNDKSSWKQFEVDDSSGSRIKILTSDGKTYDMVVGKFGYNQATRNGVSYIRRNGEDAVYAVNGFLSFAVNKPFKDWRDKTIISGNKDNWTKLTFTSPGDGTYVLSKQNNTWLVNNSPADSAKVLQYLSHLSNMQNNNLLDQYTPTSAPIYTLSVEGNNQQSPITITAYAADSVQKFIIHSSQNADGWFAENNSHTMDRIFAEPGNFLNK